MGTVLEFRSLTKSRPCERDERPATGEIVIFPGVRIERYDLDLGYRVRNSAGSGEFNGLGPTRRPNKSS